MTRGDWLSADADKLLHTFKVRLYASYGKNHSDKDVLRFLLEDISARPDPSKYIDDMINHSIYGEMEL
jgi:hypothetical protein